MTWDPTRIDRRRQRADGDGHSDVAGARAAWHLRQGDRRHSARRVEDLERRLTDTENLARANQRELDLQFQRIAQMQAELDALLKAARPAAVPPRMPHEETQRIPPDRRRDEPPAAQVPPLSRRRRP